MFFLTDIDLAALLTMEDSVPKFLDSPDNGCSAFLQVDIGDIRKHPNHLLVRSQPMCTGHHLQMHHSLYLQRARLF